MYFFAHSINSIELLDELDPNIGVEIDVRDYNGELVLGHDPLLIKYQFLESYLKVLNGRSVIANIKSERVEKPFLSLLRKYSPDSEYFFLDSSFSMIVNNGRYLNFASRLSEYESIQTSINLIENSLINWIWVDTFTKFPIKKNEVEIFNDLNVKKCLTSPDLLGRNYDIENYAKKIKTYGVIFEAICCKKENITKWKNLLI